MSNHFTEVSGMDVDQFFKIFLWLFPVVAKIPLIR